MSSTDDNTASVADADPKPSNPGSARRGITRAGLFAAAAAAVVLGGVGVASGASHIFVSSAKPATVVPTTPAPSPSTTTAPTTPLTVAPASTESSAAPADATPTAQAAAAQAPNGPAAGNRPQARTGQAPPTQVIQVPAPEPAQAEPAPAPEPAAPAAPADPGAGSGMPVDFSGINKGLFDYAQKQLDDASKNYDPTQNCTNCAPGPTP